MPTGGLGAELAEPAPPGRLPRHLQAIRHPASYDLVRSTPSRSRKFPAKFNQFGADAWRHHCSKDGLNPLRLRREWTGTVTRREPEADPDLLQVGILLRDRHNLNHHSCADSSSNEGSDLNAWSLSRERDERRRLRSDVSNERVEFLLGWLEVFVVKQFRQKLSCIISLLEYGVSVLATATLVPPDSEQPYDITFGIVPGEAAKTASMKIVNNDIRFGDRCCFLADRALRPSFYKRPDDWISENVFASVSATVGLGVKCQIS